MTTNIKSKAVDTKMGDILKTPGQSRCRNSGTTTTDRWDINSASEVSHPAIKTEVEITPGCWVEGKVIIGKANVRILEAAK